jgi:hypothetical protein
MDFGNIPNNKRRLLHSNRRPASIRFGKATRFKFIKRPMGKYFAIMG